MFKNVASQKVELFFFDYSSGAPKTGDAANLTAYVTIDHGTTTVLGDTSATEKSSTNAPGVYVFDLTQGETNGDNLTFTAKSSTANVVCVPRVGIQTLPTTGILAPATAGRTLVVDASGRVDAGAINGVSTSSVTTVSANVGTTQPVNFTGTGASAYVKVDEVAISGDTGAADNLEAMLDGTGGAGLTLSTLAVAGVIGGSAARMVLGGGDGSSPSLDVSNAANGYAASFVSNSNAVQILSTGDDCIGLDVIANGANGIGVWFQSRFLATDTNNAIHLGTNRITSTVLAASCIGASQLAAGCITSSELAASAITAIQSGLATPTNITAGTITTVTNLTNAPTNGDFTATMKASINTEADTALTDYDGPTNAELTTALAAADDAILAQVALVKAATDNLPSDPADASVIAGRFDTVDTSLAAIAADHPNRITKNVALAAFPFTMVADSDGKTLLDGLTVTAERSLDGAAFGACANAVAEIADGVYKIDLAAADLNANTVILRFTAATARARHITIVTEPT